MSCRVPIAALILTACASTAIPEAERAARDKAQPAFARAVGDARRTARAEVDRFATTYVNEFVTPDDVQRTARLTGLLAALESRAVPGATGIALGSDGSVFASRGPQAVERGALLFERLPDLRRVLMDGGIATVVVRFRGTEGDEAVCLAEIASVSRSGAVIGAIVLLVPLATLADVGEPAARRSHRAAASAEGCVLYDDEAHCGTISDEAWAVVTTRDLAAGRPVEVVSAGSRVSVVTSSVLDGDPPMRAYLVLPVH